jgi:hypothetical protein
MERNPTWKKSIWDEKRRLNTAKYYEIAMLKEGYKYNDKNLFFIFFKSKFNFYCTIKIEIIFNRWNNKIIIKIKIILILLYHQNQDEYLFINEIRENIWQYLFVI